MDFQRSIEIVSTLSIGMLVDNGQSQRLCREPRRTYQPQHLENRPSSKRVTASPMTPLRPREDRIETHNLSRVHSSEDIIARHDTARSIYRRYRLIWRAERPYSNPPSPLPVEQHMLYTMG